jgi:uncharacterized membrane protein YbhN (UPF0104 family)
MSKSAEADKDENRDRQRDPEQAMKRDEGAENAGLDGKEVQPKRPKWQKIFSLIFRFAVSVALLLWIFKSVDLGIFAEVVVSPKILPIIAMIGFSLFYVFLGGLKLWILFRDFSPISMRLFIGYFFLAGSIGSLAPAIFGDFTLIGLAKRSQIPVHKSISAILVDRFVTLVIALFIFTPFTLILVLPVKSTYVLAVTAISVALFGGLLCISVRFAPFLFGKFSATKRFWESFSIFFKGDRTNLYGNIFISSFRGIVSGITLILALMAANITPPFIPTICIANSLSILTHIPVSLSGLGVFEGSGLILFETLGLNREQVLAGLLYHRMYIIIWAFLTSLVLTLIFAIKRHSGHRDVNE